MTRFGNLSADALSTTRRLDLDAVLEYDPSTEALSQKRR
jgi:hypothetical protein